MISLRRRSVAVLLVLSASLATAGCASLPDRLARFVGYDRALSRMDVRPVLTQSTTPGPTSRADQRYQRAARAIEARNYGAALEILQVAREAAPQYIRVLN